MLGEVDGELHRQRRQRAVRGGLVCIQNQRLPVPCPVKAARQELACAGVSETQLWARPDQAGRRRNSLPSGSVSSADPSSSTAMSVAPSDTNRSISVCGSVPTVASRNRWLLRATFGVRG